MRVLIAALAFVSWGTLHTPQDPPDVEALIRKLGDHEIAEREKATRDLLALGAAARPALEKATRDPDGEIAGRATSILRRMDSHIDGLGLVLERIRKDSGDSCQRMLRDSSRAIRTACDGSEMAAIAKSLGSQGIAVRPNPPEGMEFTAKEGAYVSPAGVRHDLRVTVESSPKTSKTEATRWLIDSIRTTLVARPGIELNAIASKPYPADSALRKALDRETSRSVAEKFPIVDGIEIEYLPQEVDRGNEGVKTWGFDIKIRFSSRDQSSGTLASYFATSGLDPKETPDGKGPDPAFIPKDTILEFVNEGTQGWPALSWPRPLGNLGLKRVPEAGPKDAEKEPKPLEVRGAGDLKTLPEDSTDLEIVGKDFQVGDGAGLARFSKLRSLSWSSESTLGGPAVEHVAKLESLEALSLSSTGEAVSDKDLERLTALSRLKRLGIAYASGISDAGSVHFTKFPDLVELNLSWCRNLTDKSVKHLGGLKRLDFLRLWGFGDMTDAGLEDLAKATTLKSLSLSHVKGCTAKGWAHLANLKDLRRITLGHLSIDNEGLSTLGRLEALEEIRLYGLASITDSGLLALKNLKHLKHLSLITCPGITTDGFKALKGALPGKYELE